MNGRIVNTRTAVLLKPYRLVFEEGQIDLNEVAPDEIVAQTIVSVISPGTEIGAYQGAPQLRPGTGYPRVVGYCNVASVLAVGKKVKRLKPDDLVLSFQSHCSAFRCKENSVIMRLPDGAKPEHAASTYLYHLGYYALLRGKMTPGLNVAVIGLGPLGLTTVSMAVIAGGQVYAISHRGDARDKALRLGAKKALGPSDENLFAMVDKVTQGTGIDVVVTTSNAWPDWKFALKLVRNGGKIVVVGFPGRGQEPPDFNPLASEYFYYKQLDIIASGSTPDQDLSAAELRFTIKRNMGYLLDLIMTGRLNPDEIVTDTVSAEEIETVYKRFVNREPGLVTAALRW